MLIVLDRDEHAVWKSFRNLGKRIQIVLPEELNAYDVLVNDWIVFSTATLDAAITRLRRADDGAAVDDDVEDATPIADADRRRRRRADADAPDDRRARYRRGGRGMSARDARDVILKPVVSEKSYASYDENVYTFVVAPDANKIEIKQAIESIFGVKVTNVNTLNRSGKRKRNRKTGTWGIRTGQKRAIVTLAEGDRIEIFGS